MTADAWQIPAPVDAAHARANDALHELVRTACEAIATAKAAELDARARADRLSQLLQGASGLADAVLAGDLDDAREFARMITTGIERLPKGQP